MNSYVRTITVGLVFFWFVISATVTFASETQEDEIEFYLFELDGQLDKDGEAVFNTLLDKVLAEDRENVVLNVEPIQRALLHFWDNEKSCKYPASIRASRSAWPEYDQVPLLQSAPLSYLSGRVYTKTDRKTIHSLDEIKGKRVATIRGSLLDREARAAGARVYTVADERQLALMLVKGNVDAVVAYHPVFYASVGQDLTSRIHYDSSLLLTKMEISVVCRDFAGVDQFLRRLSECIVDMYRDHTVHDILGPYGDVIPVSDDEPKVYRDVAGELTAY